MIRGLHCNASIISLKHIRIYRLMHFPVVEIIRLLMKMRHNQPFLRISRVLSLSLVALSAIGCAGEWIKPFSPESLACTFGKVECYKGPPLGLAEYVYQLDAPKSLLLLPAIISFNAFILFVKPQQTYLILLATSFLSLFLSVFNGVSIPLNFNSSSGASLHIFSSIYLFFLSFPLAFNEQLKNNPNWQYWKYLPGYMYD